MHVTAARRSGETVGGHLAGGHLMEGTRAFLIEAYFRALGGPAPVRKQEDDLGLAVWR